MPKTAIFIKMMNWEADARMYVLSEPIKTADGRWYNKVVVSRGEVFGTHTGVVYAVNEDGSMADMNQPIEVLECSCEHEKVLEKLGYVLEIG